MRHMMLALAMVLTISVRPAHAAAVPDALQSWQDWVLHGQEFRACPYLSARGPGDEYAHRCAWPGALALDLGANGGQFRQSWQVQNDSWVVLPGNSEHWPRDVRVDGAAAAVVERNGVPQLRLGPGTHALTGRFAWNTRPEALPVAPQTALVSLTLDGRVIAQPERPDGAVWLGQRRAAVEREQLQIHVYRLLRDDIPARLVTRLRLQVSGTGREELLGVALPAGFVPLSFTGDLPARLEPDGRLRLQLRPGSFELDLEARAPSVADVVQRPDPKGTWAEEEIWSFEGVDRLRVAAVEGADAIDPAQANVPPEWHDLPAYRMGAKAELKVVERSRALANLDDNRLQVRRDLWLDFNHQGYTTQDQISGTLHRDWRLDLRAPYTLASARSGEDSLLVTKSADGTTGVELRDANLQLGAIGRLDRATGRMSATGWSTRFESVSGTLHLPPGHRLLGVLGADDAPGSWVSRWGLWNLFGVLIIVVFTFWVAGPVTAAVAAVALALMYQESPQVIWLWANVLGAIAVFRAAPEGRLKQYARYYRIASFAALVLVLLPLLLTQVRLALYPQLEAGGMMFAPANMVADMVAPAAAPVAADAAEGGLIEADQAPRTNAPPPPPKMEMPQSRELSEVMVTASNVAKYAANVSQRYASGTLLQAGPGVPRWHFNDYPYSWSGPVEESQTVRFIYLGRFALGLWRIVGVALTALLALLLARNAFGFDLRLPDRWHPLKKLTGAAAGFALVAVLATPHAVSAQNLPTPELLNDLKARLTEAPKCHPNCVDIMSASVAVKGDRLDVTLGVSALTRIAVALPHAGDRWQLDAVSLDGQSAMIVAREPDGSFWMPLAPGARTVKLSGRLANAESVQLNFPQPPRAISVSSEGWDSNGVANGRLLSGSLELVRRRTTGTAAAQLSGSEFPAFVHVTRTFNLELGWTIDTTVERIAPRAAPLQAEVPLVAGESVLTPGVEVRDGKRVLVGLARGQAQVAWNSALARSNELTLSVPADAARTELWSFAVSPQWHVEFSGLAASLPDEEEDEATWVYHYYPRAGESLKLSIARPEAAPGNTLAIDAVAFQSTFGKRSLDGSLSLNYRSTQGARHVITLPASLRVTEVLADGQPVPVRPEKGELPLSLLPGEHVLGIKWSDARGAGWRSTPDHIDLHSPASNITTTIMLPADRWPLFVHGRGVGTALLYWGELIVFIVIAWALGRMPSSPLKFHEWLLLGLGLSTLSWGVFAGVVVWLLALRWREGWKHDTTARWPFNLVQLALAALTVVAVSSLVFSGIRYGLLASPDMSIAGPGSYTGNFEWFLDRTDAVLPQPVVISVPIWVYRLLMFGWALWIALALAKWLRGAWHAWTAGGFWRNKAIVSAKA